MAQDSVDSITQYFKAMHEVAEEVDRKEMFALWQKAKSGDDGAKKRILEVNLRLVVPTAKKYYRPGIEFMDLITEGNLGLIKAIEKFDPKMGYRFSTYATYWVEHHIRQAVEQLTGHMRIPPHAWDNLRKWVKQMDKMEAHLGRKPTLTEMANHLNWSARQIATVIDSSEAMRGISLASGSESASGEDEGNIDAENIVMDSQSNSPEVLLEKVKTREEFHTALAQLDKREQTIIRMRYGIGTDAPKTLNEVGKKLKISRERTRQLENKAIAKLRRITHRMGLVEIRHWDGKRTAPNYTASKTRTDIETDILGNKIKRRKTVRK